MPRPAITLFNPTINAKTKSFVEEKTEMMILIEFIFRILEFVLSKTENVFLV